MQLKYLSQRKKNGLIVNDMSDDTVVILNKKKDGLFPNLEANDVKSAVKKRRMALSAAKFYIKIAHVYAAIASTIDPEYSYVDDNGLEQVFTLKSMSNLTNIPTHLLSNIKIKSLDSPMALCEKRINILTHKLNKESEDEITINPGEKFCSMNNEPGISYHDHIRRLSREPGINNLRKLHFEQF